MWRNFTNWLPDVGLPWAEAQLVCPSSKSDVGGKDHLAHKLGRAGKDKLTHV